MVTVTRMLAAVWIVAVGAVAATDQHKETSYIYPSTHCSYRQYRANKCPHQPARQQPFFWELLLENPFGRRDAIIVAPPVDVCPGVLCPGASTQVERVSLTDFPPERRATITFDGVPVGTINPVYTPSNYSFGSDPNAPTVSFDGFFMGQSSAGAASVSGTPSSPLALNPDAPDTNIYVDPPICLTGIIDPGQLFGGPIAIFLSQPVSAIGVEAGNAAGGTVEVTAYDATGRPLLTIQNLETGGGRDFLGMKTTDGTSLIKGLLISNVVGITPDEWVLTFVRFIVSSYDQGCCK